MLEATKSWQESDFNVFSGGDLRRMGISAATVAALGQALSDPAAEVAVYARQYRDDAKGLPGDPRLIGRDIPFSLDAKRVVLVDDVLYTGRTVRAALDAISDLGRAESVQLAVLVDRGERELPIRADYVGKNIQAPRGQRVYVRLTEIDGADAVVIGNANGK